MRFLYTSLSFLLAVAGMAQSLSGDTLKHARQEASFSAAVVTATREAGVSGRNVPQTVNVVGRDKLTETFRSSVLPTLAEQVPGLFLTAGNILGYGVNTGMGTMKVRGVGGMASLLVMVDGQPQYAGLMGHPIADSYQTLLAERVEVVSGPSSMLYGSNAMGGVVNIVTRQALRDGWHGNFLAKAGSYGTAETSFDVQMHRQKFSATAGYNFGGTDGVRTNSAFQQHSGFLKLGYDISRHWAAALDGSLTYFKASNPGTIDEPLLDNDQEITRYLGSLSLDNRYDKADGSLRLYYNGGHHHINDGYSPGGTPRPVRYVHNDYVAGVSAYETLRLFSGNHLTLGFDYKHFGGEAYNRNVLTREHIALNKTEGTSFREDELAGYADLRQDLGSYVTLEAGLRFDWHSRAGSEWVPQGSLTFHLPTRGELRMLVSKGFRNPTLRELYMFPPQNPRLEPERLMNYEVSLRQPLMEGRMHLGANLFYLKAENLITTTRIGGKPQNVNTGQTENCGVELLFDVQPVRGLRLDANYAYLHTTRLLEAAPKHKLYVGARYDYKCFGVSTSVQYVAGLHPSLDAADGKQNFVLWNATLSYRPLRWLTVFAQGENLLAQRYEIVAGYPMPRATFQGGVKISL
ncbi:MAG: TonB-dependent receptor [Alloprevotella sp.]|nr:TonB-dependent receptor [Alloprevotella sp.]